MKTLVNEIYELKNKFILIGLTGKTGSGCSTVANILKNGYVEYRAVNEKDKYITQKKDRIIKDFASKKINDKKFNIIKPSTIIMMIFFQEKRIFLNEVKRLNEELTTKNSKIICQKILDIYKNFNMFHEYKQKKDKDFLNLLLKIINEENNNIDKIKIFISNKIENYDKRLFTESYKKLLKKLCKKFKIKSAKNINLNYKDKSDYLNLNQEKKFKERLKIINLFLDYIAKNKSKKMIQWYDRYNKNIQEKRKNKEISIEALQKIGDLVRNEIDIFRIPTYINFMVKAFRAKSKKENTYCYVAIDSLKNPFEIVFFKEKYSAFYTFSIHAKDEVIYNRPNMENIKDIHNKEMYQPNSKKQKDSLDSKEDFNSQNIIECIQRSDIYIDNNLDKKDFLSKQIFKYLSLIVHPGLITPTKDESIMQLALNAKYNSGCISRQVGAVVLNKYDSVKSIGWNEVPEGQIPCNLRSHDQLLNNSPLMDYSQYEKTKLRIDDSFKYIFKKKESNQYEVSNKKGLPDSFCFKQVQNKKDDNKNQVYTRSLHAEENAFLQLAKYGNTEIIGGQLFTTASPCFLCAKKAYQLGIRRIVYIEAYPDISNEQIFESGLNEVERVHFRGAIGLAYQKLYEPLFSYKDELKALNV